MGGKSELQIEIVSKKLLGKLLNNNLNTAYTEHNADPVYGEEKSTSDTVPDISAKNVNRDMSEALMQSNKKPSVVSIVKEAMAEFKIEKDDPSWRGWRRGFSSVSDEDKAANQRVADLKRAEEAGETQYGPDRRSTALKDYYYGEKPLPSREGLVGVGAGYDKDYPYWATSPKDPGVSSTRDTRRDTPMESIQGIGPGYSRSYGQKWSGYGSGPPPETAKYGSSQAQKISEAAEKIGTTGAKAGKTFSTTADRGRGKEEESYRSLTDLYGEGKYTPDSDQPKTTSWWDRAGKDSGPEFDEGRFDVGASRAELRGRPSFRGAGSKGTTDDDWGDEGEYGGYTEEERSRLAHQAPSKVVPKKEEKKEKKIIDEGKIVSTSESGLPEGRKPGLAPTLQSEAGSPGSYSKFKVDDEGKRIPGEYQNYNKYGFTMDLKREDGRWVRDIQSIDPDIADKFFQGNEVTAKRFFETASMDDLVDRFTKSLDNGDNMNNIFNLVKEVVTDFKKAKKGGGRLPPKDRQQWKEEGPRPSDAWKQGIPRSEEPVETPSEDWQPDYEAQYGSGRGSYEATGSGGYSGEYAPYGSEGGPGSAGRGGYWSRLQPGGVTRKSLQKQVPPAMTTAPKKPPMATSATGPANVGGVNTGIPIKMSKGSKNKERQVPARKRPRPTSPKQIEAMAKSALFKLEKQGPTPDPLYEKEVAERKVGGRGTEQQRVAARTAGVLKPMGGKRGGPQVQEWLRGEDPTYSQRADVSGGGYGYDASNVPISSRGLAPGQRSIQRTLPSKEEAYSGQRGLPQQRNMGR